MIEILLILTIKIAAKSGLLIGDLDKSQHNFALPSGREKFGTIEAGTEKMHRNNLRNYCMQRHTDSTFIFLKIQVNNTDYVALKTFIRKTDFKNKGTQK